MCLIARVLVLFIASFSIVATSQANEDVRSSQDIEGLERFPNAYIERYRERKNTEQRLVLSALDKINGRVRAEREGLEKGQLTQITYRIPDGHAPEAAFNAMRKQILDMSTASPMKLLYECSGRECGSSNHWANRVFRNPSLYGLTENQHYLVAHTEGQYFIVYAVQRGNKRVYLQLDRLSYETAEMALVGDSRQFLILPEGLSINANLLNALNAHTEKVVWVVGYDRATTPYQTAIENAADLANVVKARLAADGIALERIKTASVGPLVPLMVPENAQGVYLMLE